MRLLALLVLVGVASASSDWWKTALVYQVYPRSYKDSNADGIGDLNGIKEKLPYLKELGVDAVWFSPIFLSPMYDFGYDISDFTAIAPEYGTMQDFDNLMKEAKSLGVRIMLDFVPNHTSNESEWFTKSVQRVPGYEDFYVWEDGVPDPQNPGKMLPPNNWVSVFRKSAWEWNEVRKQFYLHQFVIGQPDLNYRNWRVQDAMKEVIRFWLNKGVSGFRVDAINFMYEVDSSRFSGKLPDEPRSNIPGLTPEDYEYLSHIYSKDQDETYQVIFDWRDLLDEYSKKDGEFKLMLTEGYADIDYVMRYYGNGRRNGSVPFNFSYLNEITNKSTAVDIKRVVDQWMRDMPAGMTANWVNGNHDNHRVGTRDGTDRIDAMNALALLLPGISVTYQGEEIGMVDGYVSWEDTLDPQGCNTDDPINYNKVSRDPERTPFQWDDSAHAGFSTTTGKTWLPVADNYKTLNLEAQKKATKSHYKFYTDVVAVRKTEPVQHGHMRIEAISPDVLVVARILPGHPAVVAVINLSDREQNANLSALPEVPPQLKVVASGIDATLEKGSNVQKASLKLSAHGTVVLQSTATVKSF